MTKNMHGKSLLPLFQAETTGWRKSILTEYFHEPGFPRTPTWHAVRNQRWKYIHYDDLEGMDELYDLKVDPYELKNLIHDGGAAATLAELKAELGRLLRETN